jgi:predicted RNase H-related nuclease YkuK (DUF458 family)
MYDKARAAILNSSPQSSIYIGCDSIRYKIKDKWFAKYSTVIVVHMDSKHGCKLFHESVDLPDYGNLKQRLLNEVMYAITAATEVIDVVGDRHIEVHLDINPSPEHKSNVAVKEALGYVKGQLGLDAVIKPHAFAATHCADYLVRH